METQNMESSQGELIALEKEYWQALQNADVATCVRLTGFPCIVSGPQGVAAVDQPSYEKMMKENPSPIRSYELSEMIVQFFGPDLAVVGYKVETTMRVEGEDVGMECADVSTWTKRNGEWKCVQHSEAILGDPYGRDREAKPSVH